MRQSAVVSIVSVLPVRPSKRRLCVAKPTVSCISLALVKIRLHSLHFPLHSCCGRPQRRCAVPSSMSRQAEHRAPEVTGIVDFMHLVESLKKQPRRGWVLRNVQNPESIADHMYRMAVLALTMAGSTDIDQPRLVKMAIVHDIAEAIVGDITPVCGVSEEDKYKQELSAIMEIQDMLGADTNVAAEVLELWHASKPGSGITRTVQSVEVLHMQERV